VKGRNAITWGEKFEWDVRYVDKITFLGDWKIIFKTFLTVIKKEGICEVGVETVSEFMGSSSDE
jgi:lipopolysaccharide/colanic/teichoic acid biosynthesis glycosyltransferase